MSQGVLLSSRAVALHPGPERLLLLKKHAVVQTLACLAILGGFYAIYKNKEVHGKPHFTSYHSKLGVVTLAATFLAPLTGALGFKYLGLFEYLGEWGSFVKALHRKKGLIAYFMS